MRRPRAHRVRLEVSRGAWGEEVSVINPILTGISSAAQALEALFAATQGGPASSSAGAFSTGQGLPSGGAQQTAPSNPSNRFAPAALGFLTALQDPDSAAAGFVSGAETAIGHDVSSFGSVLEKLKDALTGVAPGSASAAASALSIGSAAAGALSVATASIAVGALGQLTSGLAALFGDGHHLHHHHHGGWGQVGGAGAAGSAGATGAVGSSAAPGAGAVTATG